MTTRKKRTENPESVVSLTEYCRRLSVRERRVELIGGFHSAMKAEGVLSDTEAGYDGHFAAFLNRPA